MANEIDIDPQETQEWLDSLRSVLEHEGVELRFVGAVALDVDGSCHWA